MVIRVLILVVFVGGNAFAVESMRSKFEKIEGDLSNVKDRIEILLKAYGAPNDFKIIEEKESQEVCASFTRIRGRKSCDKKSTREIKTYFAESVTLLCKIDDHLEAIKCLPKATENK